MAISYNNIGNVHLNKAGAGFGRGEYAKALEFFEKALAIDLKKLGPNHPSTKLTKGLLDRLPKE